MLNRKLSASKSATNHTQTRYQQPYERQCQHQPTDRIRKKCQRFAKLKEVQADTQSQRYCTTFNFAVGVSFNPLVFLKKK